MTVRPARRLGGPGRRTRPIRRSSAGLTPARAGSILAMLLSAGAIYGLASTSAFSYSRLLIEGTTIVADAAVREELALPEGENLFEIVSEPLETRLRGIPAVAEAEVSIGLPDTVKVRIEEREPLLVWRVGERRWYVDRTGFLFAQVGQSPPPEAATLPLVSDDRSASLALRVGHTIAPIDLDVATRLGSLTPAQVGSSAAGLAVGVTDENGFVLSSSPKSWVAVFGFYGRSLRTPDLVEGQVQLLDALLTEAGEPNVALIILADDRDGTYIPKESLSPSPSAAP
jgi:hypothetical protein